MMQERLYSAPGCTSEERFGEASAAGETLGERMRRSLEQDIARGDLAPGARLDEKEIAERFGVSRTPVREAFRLLAANGLVELRGRQGAIVREIGVNQLLEMFQVMAELEGLCARLAARRITPAQRAMMSDIHARLEAMGEENDPARFYQINLEFHEVIYEASRNDFLAEQTRSLRNRVGAYRLRVTYLPERVRHTLKEHAEVMEAIFAHDAERAHAAMRAHLTLLGDDLIDFIAQFGKE
ncbi:GntR family transcriptional regulator [Halotalea alkalilenta]|uniref:GntR family transcriptional regulator n=1 Tax=Halotalea alkalilenta TaxID=376489 RepID=UPI000ADAC010|nr:GntR family transcriptional regulator [Halotalea alkalilenta]